MSDDPGVSRLLEGRAFWSTYDLEKKPCSEVCWGKTRKKILALRLRLREIYNRAYRSTYQWQKTIVWLYEILSVPYEAFTPATHQ